MKFCVFGIIIATIYFLGFINLTKAQTSNDVIDFFTNTNSPFTSYNSKIRPKLNQDEVLSVDINFGLTSITGLDEIGGTLYLVGFLEATWEDQLLNWTAEDYGNLEKVMLTQADVWTPSLTLHTSVKSLSELGESASPVEVTNNGYIKWKPGLVIETGCSIDVSYYPFDVQNCDVTFIPWQYTADMVQLFPKETTVDTSIMQLSSEWDLNQTTVKNTTGVYSQVTYTLTLKRRPQFFVLNMILPIILIGFLNGFVFVMPFEQGRVGFIITGFLSIGIFLTLVSDILPKSSNPMSLLGYFLIWQLMLGALCTLESILTLKIYFREGKIDLPGSLKKFLAIVWFYPCRGRGLTGKKKETKAKSKEENDETDDTKEKEEVKDNDEKKDDGIDDSNEDVIDDEENKKDSKKKETSEIEATWATLGGTMDVLFFILFLILSLIIYMMFLLPLATNA